MCPTTSACGGCACHLPGLRPVGQRASGRVPARHHQPAAHGGPTTDLDWVVVRENTEGEYAGFGGRNFCGRGAWGEVATQSALFTEVGCERIIRFAFELARTRTRKKVSSVTKSNAQQYGMVLWDDVFKRVARSTPTSRPRAFWSTPWPRSSCSVPRSSPSWSPPT